MSELRTNHVIVSEVTVWKTGNSNNCLVIKSRIYQITQLNKW